MAGGAVSDGDETAVVPRRIGTRAPPCQPGPFPRDRGAGYSSLKWGGANFDCSHLPCPWAVHVPWASPDQGRPVARMRTSGQGGGVALAPDEIGIATKGAAGRSRGIP
jgi:hypothetical protein